MKTITTKSTYNGWNSKTSVNLNDKQVLEISTSKHSTGVLVSHASVSTVEGNMLSHACFLDYSQRIRHNGKKTTATEKSINQYHQETLQDIDNIIAQALAWYDKPLENGCRFK